MIQKFLSPKSLLILILLVAAFLRLFRLDYPNQYVFDEVYHAFTAKEYLRGSKDAWEFWIKPPPGVAYEWTHPPLAKELMAASMWLVGSQDGWVYRLPGALLGVVGVYFVYLIGKELFKNESVALVSTFIFSLDGLNFVQSRVGMNDIYFVSFTLASLLFFLRKQFVVSAVFLGLTIASKWTGVYLLGGYTVLGFSNFMMQNNILKKIPNKLFSESKVLAYYIFIPVAIYLATYIPFFLLGHTFDQFIELQQQMWWYHTNLKASHDYASAWWTWPLNLYPVWYFVDYHKDGTISNIFASGNIVVFWFGALAITLTVWDFLKQKWGSLLTILLFYLIFWLPWALSPRIMFLYHYSPSVPFLSLALGYQISKFYSHTHSKSNLVIFLGAVSLGFLIYYPILTGIPLPKDLLEFFFKINLAKNPF